MFLNKLREWDEFILPLNFNYPFVLPFNPEHKTLHLFILSSSTCIQILLDDLIEYTIKLSIK